MDLDAAPCTAGPTGLVVVASAEVLARVRDLLAAEYRLQVAATQAEAVDMAASATSAELVVMDMDAPSSTALAQQTAAVQDVTILAMAALAETRDSDTGNHLRRTQHYVRALARKLSIHPRFSAVLTPKNIGMIFKSVPLHDIGKVCLPDRVLLKPGKLTEEEFEIMKTHTTLGRDAIIAAETGTTQDNPFFRYAKEIAYSHQEKWDGSGYPEGLVGNTIPLSARLMAVADVYDALISERVYKPSYSHEQAVKIIRDGRGSHFDPDMVDAFLALSEEFRRIAQQFADAEPARLAQVDRLAADLPMERIELTSREDPL